MNHRRNRFGGRGTTLTEVLIGINVMIVALLGLDSAVKDAQAQVRGKKEVSLAKVEILAAVEEFRAAAVQDLDRTLAAYRKGISRNLGDLPMGRNVRLLARLVPDQPQLHLKMTWDGALGRREFQHLETVSERNRR